MCDLRAPERALEPFAEIARLLLQPSARVGMAEQAGAAGGELLGAVHVGLDLGERRSGPRPGDRRHGRPSRCESFQPWLDRPLSVARAYSTKPSPSRSPGPSIQRERRLDRRPQVADRPQIAGALHVEAGEQHEQRGRVDAAVVAGGTALRPASPSRRRASRAGSCPARRRTPRRNPWPASRRAGSARRARCADRPTASASP